MVRGEKEPLVSIVIPTFNSAKTLRECLVSIKRQTYSNLEVIIVDKGSRDGTVRIAREMGYKTYVIKAYERSEQMNFGAKVAKGKYVYIINSDFLLEPNVVSEAVYLCERGV